jgi:hypothetical protein
VPFVEKVELRCETEDWVEEMKACGCPHTVLLFVEYMYSEIFSNDLQLEYGFKLGTVTHHLFLCSLGPCSNLFLLHGEAVINICHITQTLATQVSRKVAEL